MKTRFQLLIGIFALSAFISTPLLAENKETNLDTPGAEIELTEEIKEETTPDAVSDPTPEGENTEIPSEANAVSESTNLFNYVQQASENNQLTTLFKAIEAAGLQDTLNGDEPYTFFAPTDQAFAELPEQALAELMEPKNKELLQQVLKNHLVQGAISSSEQSGEVTNLANSKVQVEVNSDGQVSSINGANVTDTVQASNGTLYVIDKLIIPSQSQASTTETAPVDSEVETQTEVETEPVQ